MGTWDTTTILVCRVPYDYIRDHFVFNTEKYLFSKDYNPDFGRRPMKDSYGNSRKVNKADGILVTGYRLRLSGSLPLMLLLPARMVSP